MPRPIRSVTPLDFRFSDHAETPDSKYVDHAFKALFLAAQASLRGRESHGFHDVSGTVAAVQAATGGNVTASDDLARGARRNRQPVELCIVRMS